MIVSVSRVKAWKAIAVGVLPALLAGCHTAPRRVVSAIPSNTTDALFVSEHAGLAREAAKNGLSVYWNGPNREAGISRQIALTERAIADNDFGIVLSPVAPFALDSVVERALAKKIPVVILGPPLRLAPHENLSFVSGDIERTGQLAAGRIHALVGDAGEVALVGIDPMEPGSTDCARAFEAALAKEAPRVRIVSRLVGTLSAGQTEMAVSQALEEHPKIAAIYALNLNDTRGAAGAIHGAGRDGQVKLVGNNQSLDLMMQVRHGTVDALIVQDMRSMGEQAVRNVVAARAGQSVAARSLFEPVLLTRDNIDSEAMQQRVKLDWRPQS